MNNFHFNPGRRKILKLGATACGALLASPFLVLDRTRAATIKLSAINSLQAPDTNGIRLPPGFSSRIIAQSGDDLFGYRWHAAPDGGATFASTKSGGWIYVSNSELKNNTGGVGAIHFDHKGQLIDAYSILENTTLNCAGGATPWQTWLSCEETERGRVWECDPFGKKPPVPHEALGRFKHEAVAVDLDTMQLYLTEDEPDGCLYRYTANKFSIAGFPDLDDGSLEVMTISPSPDRKVTWRALPDPSARLKATRKQIRQATHFNGGEGIWFQDGVIYFTTKGDNRVWAYHTKHHQLDILYDAAWHTSPVLTGVDNITANNAGELLVAEDGGNMQIVILSGQTIKPLLQIVDQKQSEITGPAFSPDGTRLYFSSQRGKTGRSENGITYEITGFA